MRILLITGLTSYGVGGARVEMMQLLRGIAAAGHIAGLCADHLPDQAPAGVAHFKVSYPFRSSVRSEIADAIRQFQPDVVHVVGGGIRFLRAAHAAIRQTEVPWVLTIHNVPPAERIVPYFFDHPRLHRLTRWLITAPSLIAWRAFLERKNADVILCHSRRVEEAIRAGGGRRQPVEIIPLGEENPNDPVAGGIGNESCFPAGASPKLLSIGGLAPHKGQLELIRAIAQLRDRFPNIACQIIGAHRSRRFRDHLHRTIERLVLGRHISLVGPAAERRKRAVLREADVYVQPSREEGFCLAFLEAAAISPKLVGTDTGAIADVAAHHPCAIVVPPDDADALADGIRQIVAHPSPTEAEMDRTRADLNAAFSWADHLARHLAVYQVARASSLC